MYDYDDHERPKEYTNNENYTAYVTRIWSARAYTKPYQMAKETAEKG